MYSGDSLVSWFGGDTGAYRIIIKLPLHAFPTPFPPSSPTPPISQADFIMNTATQTNRCLGDQGPDLLHGLMVNLRSTNQWGEGGELLTSSEAWLKMAEILNGVEILE